MADERVIRRLNVIIVLLLVILAVLLQSILPTLLAVVAGFAVLAWWVAMGWALLPLARDAVPW
ncbi:hypothetical protein [Halostella salina]|uniref:hypothetical protein n=1 Tax=Halostella salina TaxID=1547897 RepID=UPI00196A1909|nr:hypothetical protein [Halostella salina]